MYSFLLMVTLLVGPHAFADGAPSGDLFDRLYWGELRESSSEYLNLFSLEGEDLSRQRVGDAYAMIPKSGKEPVALKLEITAKGPGADPTQSPYGMLKAARVLTEDGAVVRGALLKHPVVLPFRSSNSLTATRELEARVLPQLPRETSIARRSLQTIALKKPNRTIFALTLEHAPVAAADRGDTISQSWVFVSSTNSVRDAAPLPIREWVGEVVQLTDMDEDGEPEFFLKSGYKVKVLELDAENRAKLRRSLYLPTAADDDGGC